MALRAKKPEASEQSRLKVLLYADKGAGKTHLCCSLPDVYYIDTEGLKDHKKFRDMLRENKSDLVYLTELSEIIKEVQELLSVKHRFKTVVIDSISFPVAWLAQLEAERLANPKTGVEGTEFGANLAKAKRLVFKLGILLSRLDMNVIVIAHEKPKFIDNKDMGKTFDVNDKMAYSLGAVWHLRLQGKFRKLFVEKSRYSEMETAELIDFENGWEVLKSRFGVEIFSRDVKTIDLATKEQIEELQNLILVLNIEKEKIDKWLTNCRALSFDDVEKDAMQKCIDHFKSTVLKTAA